MAARFVASYKGYPPLPADVAHFVRELVMDALVAAPQPVTHAWVRHSLGLAGNFARWCADQGMPLDRDVLLTRPVINRWVHVGLVSKAAGTQATYRSRLEILADCVATTPWDRAGRYALVKSEPSLPLTAQEQADAWLWAANLGNLRLRHRMMAFLALGLGCGLTMSEEGALRREDVTRDLAGVHVTVQHGRNHEVRTVTCRRDWEVRLWEVVKATPDGCLVPTPSRAQHQSRNAYRVAYAQAFERYPAPVSLTHHRTRITWLAEHIMSGTPLPVLLAAAGLKNAQTLIRLLPVLPEVDSGEATMWLRGVP